MPTNIKQRLKRIERLLPKPVAAECASPVPEIARWLAERGFVAGPQECLADVWGAGDGDELPRASGAVAVAGGTSLAN